MTLIRYVMGDPPYRHLEYADVVARQDAELAALRQRIRDGYDVPAPEVRARQMWDGGATIGEIAAATSLSLGDIYQLTRETP